MDSGIGVVAVAILDRDAVAVCIRTCCAVVVIARRVIIAYIIVIA